jgi:hypothetical protein
MREKERSAHETAEAAEAFGFKIKKGKQVEREPRKNSDINWAEDLPF